MHRRQVLAVIGTTVPFAGCSSTAADSNAPNASPTQAEPEIEVGAPIVTQGETASVTIDAKSVSHLRFRDLPDIDAAVEYENAEFSPPPSAVYQRRPPTWQWSPPETITGNVPIHISESVPADDYRYAIAVQQTESDEELIQEFTLAVED